MTIKPPNYKYCPFCASTLSTRTEEGRKRKYCSGCGWRYFPSPGIAVAAVIMRKGEVLLVKRNRRPFKGMWMFPAGFVEYGEDLPKALAREVAEETGLTVSKTKLINVFQSQNDWRSPAHFVAFFRTRARGSAENLDKDENQAVKWFPIANPPIIGFPTHRLMIDRLRSKIAGTQRCAIFGVDLQNCFGHPKGSLYVRGGEKVIGPGNNLISFGVKNGCIILFSADWHPKNSRHFKKWPVHGVAGTWGAEFLNGLLIPVGSHILHKATGKDEDGYDPFEGKTENGLIAQEILKQKKINTIIFFGLATDYCVKAGVLTACKLGYRVLVAIDACRAVNKNPGDEQVAIREMGIAGAIITTVREVLNGKF